MSLALRVFLAAAVLGAFTAWTLVHAGTDGPTAGTDPPAWRHGHRGGPGPLGFLMHELDLSADQQAQIRTMIEDARQQDAPLRQQLEDLRNQVHDAVVANGYDENQIRALVQAKSPVMVEMTVRGIATLAKIRAVLTPAQQQKLEQLRTERPGFGGPGFGGPGAGMGFGPPPAL